MNNNLPESFTSAKINLANNLGYLISAYKFTPTSFAMMFNSISSVPVVSTDIIEWANGIKLPNIYQLYKIAMLLDIPLDIMFSTEFSKRLADTSITAATTSNPTLVTNTPLPTANITTQEKSMAIKTNVVSISKTSKRKMDELVRTRTTSRTYNVLLANKIYSSDMTLKEIASKVGTSTRSIRDYAFYGTTIPAEIAGKFVSMFKTSYRNLGLSYNEDRNRYEHMKVSTKA